MINELNRQEAQNALNQAAQAFRRGDRTQARRWASLAARLDPQNEKPWLILAGLASPQASVAYLNKALELNPNSQQARQGMEWAVRRLRKHEATIASQAATRPIPVPAPTHPAPPPVPLASTRPVTVRRQRRAPSIWVVLMFLFVFSGLCVAGLSGAWIVLANSSSAERAISMLLNPSPSPSIPPPTATLLPSATLTLVPTATAEPPTPTLEPPTATAELPTATLEPEATSTPDPVFPDEEEQEFIEVEPSVTPFLVDTLTPEPPTEVPDPTDIPLPEPGLPDGVGAGEHWVDVDLSDQMVYAYEGTNLVNSFLVSTGTWMTPTVTGQFKVYVKYRYADMSGPGYYLADVPYVMYFYKGYGLHGTYWHNNFGTPMSHGCVNLRTDDAGWLFDWSSVGTVVNVHD